MSYTSEQIFQKLKDFTYWYHKIELAPGIVTKGFDLDPLWENVRKVRSHIPYQDKVVLDIASFDGMFAFEAEKLGARHIVATDCLYKSFNNFLFCREVFESKVIPYYNVSPYRLTERLDCYFGERYPGQENDVRKFDVVQHLGLLYHLRDPLLSIAQARSVLKDGGYLLIETDVIMDRDESFMLFNGLPDNARVRDNYSVWWAPTRKCLFEMLNSSLFEVMESTYSEFEFLPPAREEGKVLARQGKENYRIGRGAVVARAINDSKLSNQKLASELRRTYRNPGLDFSLLDNQL